MKYDFTDETVNMKLREAFKQLYFKLLVLSSVLATTDVAYADIRFKCILDELTTFKTTETFDILKAYYDYMVDRGTILAFMDAFSDEMFTALKAKPKKISDVLTVYKNLNSSAKFSSKMSLEN